MARDRVSVISHGTSAAVNRSAPVSVLRLGTEAAIAGAVASPQCFPADPAMELWLPPFSISRRRR